MYWNDIIKVKALTNLSGLSVDAEYLVKYDGTDASTPWKFFLVNKTTSPVSFASSSSLSLSETDYFALGSSDKEHTGFVTQVYDLVSTNSNHGVSTTGKYAFSEQKYFKLTSNATEAWIMGDGDGTASAKYVKLNADGSVDTASGILVADGSGSNETKTNATLQTDVGSATSGATLSMVTVTTRTAYDSTKTDPTQAFTAETLVAALPTSDGSTSVTPSESIQLFTTSTTTTTTPVAPTSGDVYALTTDEYGTHAAGNYIIVKEGSDFVGYLVTGSSPSYTIATSSTALSGMTQTVYDNLSGPAFTISAASSGSGTGAAYAGPTGETTIADSKAVDLSSKTIYSIDADVIGANGDAGVTTDGLYVFDGNDTNGWTAYRLGGNAQQGWNVVEKVSNAFALEATFNGKAAGTLSTLIVDIGASQVADATRVGGTAAEAVTGRYALIADGSNFDAYEVTGGGDGAPFQIGDKIFDDLLTSTTLASAKTAGMDIIGYLETAGSTSYAGGTSDAALFAIERVAGERYGNIVTYGVKLNAGDLGESVTFDSLTFNVKWEAVTGGSADYSFWGQFKPAAHAPAVGANSASASGNPVTFFNEGTGDGITFGMYADSGIKFDQDEYIATFMLEKDNSDAENTLYLNTAQYTLYDATNMDGVKAPETPLYGTQADPTAGTVFNFGYANHDVGLNLETIRDQNLSDVELLVTNVAKGEGLSLVPVAKNGNVIQYQLVMNVPIPTFIQAAESTSAVTIDPDHKIVITGADIFDKSVSWMTDLAHVGSQTSALVSGATLHVNGAAATAEQKAVAGTHTGHNFYDIVREAFDPRDGRSDLSDLDTSSTLTLEIKGLNLPDVPAASAEGRYVLAEFAAISGATTAITYQSSQGDGSYGSASSHTITRIADADGSNAGTTGTPWDNSVADGAEVTALADAIYTNEQAYNDAIGAEDALGALKISRDGATTVANNTYSQTEIIAADFNMDGSVSAADAYDILQYAVHGHESGGPTAKWIYVDNIAGNQATPGNVTFDRVIDEFVGESFDLDATAILLGDVSSSYSGPPSASATYTDLTFTQLEKLSGLGIADMTVQFAAADGTATGTSGRDLIYIADKGVHTITGLTVSKDSNDVMTGDIIALSSSVDAGIRGGTAATAITLSTAPTAASDVVSAVRDAIYGGGTAPKDYVIATYTDSGSGAITHQVLAYDTNGDDDFDTTNDLLIFATGNGIHYVGDPLNTEVFTLSDFTVA